MREGEGLGLMWDCVDFDTGTITINKQLQHYRDDPGNAFRIVPTKNTKGRTITPAPLCHGPVAASLCSTGLLAAPGGAYVGTLWPCVYG